MAHAREIVWSDTPDLERGVYYPICAPKPDAPVEGIVLSECIVGAETYYEPAKGPGEKGHSLPCTCKHDSPCPGRQAKRDHRWKGYLACWDRNKGRLFLAELTKEAYTRCSAFETFKGRLRGTIVRLTRNGIASNSRVTATLRHLAADAFQLPPAFNVRSALERIWFGHEGPPIRHPGSQAGAALAAAQNEGGVPHR